MHTGYAYKIDHPHTTTAEQIHIIFLKGTSNDPIDGSTLPSDYIVHPAFTFGDQRLSGIWVAKYEASSSDPNILQSGDTYNLNGYTGGASDTSLQVRVLPDVYSWRNIDIEDIQTVCMNIKNSNGSLNSNNVDTHQMKNIEWGAVAYLSQSKYGEEPWINPYGDYTSGSYKFKTGYSGENKDNGILSEGSSQLHKYNDLTYGVNASTTHNIYGIYDMCGGSNEYVAAILENGDPNITSFLSKYTLNRKIKSDYEKYYDIYEPGNDEMDGGKYSGYAEEMNKLWISSSPYNVDEVNNNVIRKSLVDATYAKMINKKGDAMYETSNGTSYQGKFSSGSIITDANYAILVDTIRDSSKGHQYACAWNNDMMIIVHSWQSFFGRGEDAGASIYAGLFANVNPYGNGWLNWTFRPVLITK